MSESTPLDYLLDELNDSDLYDAVYAKDERARHDAMCRWLENHPPPKPQEHKANSLSEGGGDA
jgi:hypothetical protein